MAITNVSDVAASSSKPAPSICPSLPGTVLRIFIPPGAVINLLNLIEITSPGGICIIVRLPFLAGDKDKKHTWDAILAQIKEAGGTVEVVNS